jgi:hypothetical protein
MKKVLISTIITLFTLILSREEAQGQALFITNNLSYQIEVTICGTTYIIPANTSAPSVSACVPAPCSFTVKIPCSGGGTKTVNVTDSNCGSCGVGFSTSNFAADLAPPCDGFTTKYAVDCSRNITIIVQP